LDQGRFYDCDLSNYDVTGANFNSIIAYRSSFVKVKGKKVSLIKAEFNESTFYQANLFEAQAARSSFINS